MPHDKNTVQPITTAITIGELLIASSLTISTKSSSMISKISSARSFSKYSVAVGISSVLSPISFSFSRISSEFSSTFGGFVTPSTDVSPA